MFRGLGDSRVPAQRLGMMNFSDLASVPSGPLVPFPDQLRLAVAAYLARFTGSSRQHTESDLRCYLSWCAERSLDPLAGWPPRPVYWRGEGTSLVCAPRRRPKAAAGGRVPAGWASLASNT
jgi:hypothetical protein